MSLSRLQTSRLANHKEQRSGPLLGRRLDPIAVHTLRTPSNGRCGRKFLPAKMPTVMGPIEMVGQPDWLRQVPNLPAEGRLALMVLYSLISLDDHCDRGAPGSWAVATYVR